MGGLQHIERHAHSLACKDGAVRSRPARNQVNFSLGATAPQHIESRIHLGFAEVCTPYEEKNVEYPTVEHAGKWFSLLHNLMCGGFSQG